MEVYLSKVEGCGGLGGSRLTWGDKEVTMQYLELKGGDRGACKLLGDVIEVLGCLLEVLGCLKWVKMQEKGCRVHFILGLGFRVLKCGLGLGLGID
ncbi:hypothetical protein Tco_1145161 [Tanacetum coccineum]